MKEGVPLWSRVRGCMLLRTSSLEGGEQNLGFREMSQRCPFLGNIAHKSLTATFVCNNQGIAEGNVFCKFTNRQYAESL
jgi:hypothetical protein